MYSRILENILIFFKDFILNYKMTLNYFYLIN